MWYLAGYIGTIFGANLAISTFGAVPVGFGLLAPAGVYFAGLGFTLRDLTQNALGARASLLAILVGAALSGTISGHFALASGAAFLFSEFADFLVYSPLRRRGYWLAAFGIGNTVGVVVDSALFLALAFGSQEFLAGQVVGKSWITAATLAILWAVRRLNASRVAVRAA